MDDGKSEADAVTEDPPPEMCIVSMSKEDVRAWLQLKCDDEESQFFKSMRSPRGEILATRTRDRFKSDIGDDGIAEDIFTQVTINLETYGSDTIAPKMFAAVMKTRGTPVTQQHPPQEDASEEKVFVFSCKFPSGAHSTYGARRSIFSLLEQCQEAWTKPDTEYVSYDKIGDDPKQWPLLVEVFSQTLIGVKKVEQMVKRFDMPGVTKCVMSYKETLLKEIGIDSWHQLRLCAHGDYNPNLSDSACQDSDFASAGQAPSATILSSQSPIVTYQAITMHNDWFKPEKLHLIPKWLVNTPARLAEFPSEFWDLAEEKFGLSRDHVEKVLDLHAVGHYNLNDNPVNFIAAHRAFHNAFDGIYGERVKFTGTETSADGTKRAKTVVTGGVVKLIISARSEDITEGSKDPSAQEKEKRSQVKLNIEFFTKTDFDVGKQMIPDSTECQERELVLFKTIRVTDSQTFLTALNFKATLNLASHRVSLGEGVHKGLTDAAP
eukprot:m.152820 g.152820  ORF g.152820 m.152820 type:complete len:492 (-) comp11704_c3_seq67:197-1672(-)